MHHPMINDLVLLHGAELLADAEEARLARLAPRKSTRTRRRLALTLRRLADRLEPMAGP